MGRIKGALRGGMEEMEVEVSSLSLRSDTFLPDASSPSIVAARNPRKQQCFQQTLTLAPLLKSVLSACKEPTTSTEDREKKKSKQKKKDLRASRQLLSRMSRHSPDHQPKRLLMHACSRVVRAGRRAHSGLVRHPTLD